MITTLKTLTIAEKSSGVMVTAVTKLKHADLLVAAKKMGGQRLLAEHLGVHVMELNQWINLQRVPPANPSRGKWSESFLCSIESKLLVLTGKSWEELFPESLRCNKQFLRESKTIEKTAELSGFAIANYAAAKRERLQQDDDYAERVRESVAKLMQQCSSRERTILSMRYGIDDGEPKTLEEVSRVLRVSKERVRSLEARAIRRLFVNNSKQLKNLVQST